MSEPRRPLLGPWPPDGWGQHVEDEYRFPSLPLRVDVLLALQAIHRYAGPDGFPAADAEEVLATLNEVGPPLDRRALPLIRSTLEGLFRAGLAGKLPAPTPHHEPGYLIREAAELVVRLGGPVLLLPLGPHHPRGFGGGPEAAATCEPENRSGCHQAPATEAQGE